MRFFDALAFLTVVRLPGRRAPSLNDVAAAQAWFPAVGLLLGTALLALDRAGSRALPGASVDVLLVVALVVLTGALHLDGLADSADGLFGGGTPERRLAIMRDVHSGTYAVVAIVSVLALKWAGFTALPGDVRFEALLLAPCIARCGMLATIAALPYVRADGLGTPFPAQQPAAALIGGASAVVVAVVLLGASGLLVLALGVAGALVLGVWVARLAGGMTGDLYGAVVEVTEALTLLMIAALANRGIVEAWVLR